MKNVTLSRVINIFLVLLLFFIILRIIYQIIFSSAPDFSVLWTGTKDLISFKNPYINPSLFTGIGYPPFSLLFYIPFVFLPYFLAQALFIILSILSVIGSVYISIKINNRFSFTAFVLALLLSFLSFPTKFTLGMGQVNAIALFLLLIGFYLFKRSRYVLAGIMLGFATCLKPLFIFLWIFFFLRRNFKLLIVAFLIVIVHVLGSLFFGGVGLYFYYFINVVPPLLNFVGREVYYNQGVLGFVSRLTGNILLRKIAYYVSFVGIAVSTIFLGMKNKNDNIVFSIFLISLVLLDSLSWQHHFLWLVFPFITVFTMIRVKKIRKFFFVMFWLSYLLVSWNFKNPKLFQIFPLNLLLSHTFLGALILFAVSLLLLWDNKK